MFPEEQKTINFHPKIAMGSEIDLHTNVLIVLNETLEVFS